ncbi:hypothetical protein SAMN04487906_0161 [Zhouia amylolytica]|uniref:Secreted protein n=4 Tax=Zhouia amylolytica TaxID=376730 RepID=W2UHZ9_9FLAO|nr:hypothetical protein P278_31650 [Zhouia amylolytica AD3]SFS36316.1 hypothetical protein SAMN04487906_0161 [Zhouia amylolytica]
MTMALLVLFSTVSFAVSKHYCGDFLVDVAVVTQAETCGMQLQQSSKDDECSFQKSSCCTDQIKLVEGQDEVKTSVNDLDFQQQVFLASFVYTYINLFEGLEQNVIPHKNYPPPFLVKDIHILDEVFLI